MPTFAEVRQQYPGWNDNDILDDIARASNKPVEYVAGYLGYEQPAARGQSKGLMGDLWNSTVRGVQQLPGIATGLADLPIAAATGARPFTAAADAVGEFTGIQPGQWAKDRESRYSAGYKGSQEEVNAAWAQVEKAGLMDQVKELFTNPEIAKAYATNPSYVLNQVMESLPSMLAGGVGSRVLLGAAGKAGMNVGSKWAVPVAAGAGEGAVTAGQQMAGYEGEDQQRNAWASAGAGLMTGGIGALGGRLAQSVGLETPETFMAGRLARGETVDALNTPAGRAVLEAGTPDATPWMSRTMPRRIAGGAVAEGLFQELPQSMQEQAWQNIGAGNPWQEGVARAGVEGAMAGGLMGAGFNVGGRVDPQEQYAKMQEQYEETKAILANPEATVEERREAADVLNSLQQNFQPPNMERQEQLTDVMERVREYQAHTEQAAAVQRTTDEVNTKRQEYVDAKVALNADPEVAAKEAAKLFPNPNEAAAGTSTVPMDYTAEEQNFISKLPEDIRNNPDKVAAQIKQTREQVAKNLEKQKKEQEQLAAKTKKDAEKKTADAAKATQIAADKAKVEAKKTADKVKVETAKKADVLLRTLTKGSTPLEAYVKAKKLLSDAVDSPNPDQQEMVPALQKVVKQLDAASSKGEQRGNTSQSVPKGSTQGAKSTKRTSVDATSGQSTKGTQGAGVQAAPAAIPAEEKVATPHARTLDATKKVGGNIWPSLRDKLSRMAAKTHEGKLAKLSEAEIVDAAIALRDFHNDTEAAPNPKIKRTPGKYDDLVKELTNPDGDFKWKSSKQETVVTEAKKEETDKPKEVEKEKPKVSAEVATLLGEDHADEVAPAKPPLTDALFAPADDNDDDGVLHSRRKVKDEAPLKTEHGQVVEAMRSVLQKAKAYGEVAIHHVKEKAVALLKSSGLDLDHWKFRDFERAYAEATGIGKNKNAEEVENDLALRRDANQLAAKIVAKWIKSEGRRLPGVSKDDKDMWEGVFRRKLQSSTLSAEDEGMWDNIPEDQLKVKKKDAEGNPVYYTIDEMYDRWLKMNDARTLLLKLENNEAGVAEREAADKFERALRPGKHLLSAEQRAVLRAKIRKMSQSNENNAILLRAFLGVTPEGEVYNDGKDLRHDLTYDDIAAITQRSDTPLSAQQVQERIQSMFVHRIDGRKIKVNTPDKARTLFLQLHSLDIDVVSDGNFNEGALDEEGENNPDFNPGFRTMEDLGKQDAPFSEHKVAGGEGNTAVVGTAFPIDVPVGSTEDMKLIRYHLGMDSSNGHRFSASTYANAIEAIFADETRQEEWKKNTSKEAKKGLEDVKAYKARRKLIDSEVKKRKEVEAGKTKLTDQQQQLLAAIEEAEADNRYATSDPLNHLPEGKDGEAVKMAVAKLWQVVAPYVKLTSGAEGILPWRSITHTQQQEIFHIFTAYELGNIQYEDMVYASRNVLDKNHIKLSGPEAGAQQSLAGTQPPLGFYRWRQRFKEELPDSPAKEQASDVTRTGMSIEDQLDAGLNPYPKYTRMVSKEWDDFERAKVEPNPHPKYKDRKTGVVNPKWQAFEDKKAKLNATKNPHKKYEAGKLNPDWTNREIELEEAAKKKAEADKALSTPEGQAEAARVLAAKQAETARLSNLKEEEKEKERVAQEEATRLSAKAIAEKQEADVKEVIRRITVTNEKRVANGEKALPLHPLAIWGAVLRGETVESLVANPPSQSVRDTPVTTPSTVAKVESAVRELFGTNKWDKNRLQIYPSFMDVPAELKAHFDEGTQAIAFAGDKAILVADQIEAGTEHAIILHEVGNHVGLTDAQVNKLAAKIEAMGKGGSRVERTAYAAATARATANSTPATYNKELVGYMAEELVARGVKPTAVSFGGRFLQQILDMFKDMLAKLGMTGEFTGQDVIDLLQGATAKVLAGNEWKSTGTYTYQYSHTVKNPKDPIHIYGAEDSTDDVGFVAVGLNANGVPHMIYNLRVEKERAGVGEKIVQDILRKAPLGVKVNMILPDAVDFWKKMGVELDDGYKTWDYANGFLTQESYELARGTNVGAERSNGLDQSTDEAQKGNEGDGAQAGEAGTVLRSRRPATEVFKDALNSPQSFDISHYGRVATDSLMYTHDLVDKYKGTLKAAKTWYDSMIKAMERKLQYERVVERIVEQVGDEKNRAAINKFLSFSTVEQKWAKQFSWLDHKVTVDPEAARRWNSLTPQQQKVAEAVFKHGQDVLKQKRELIKKTGDGVLHKKMSELQGPYVPLKRFGHHIAVWKSATLLALEKQGKKADAEKLKQDRAHYTVSFFDTPGAARDFVKANSGSGGAYQFTKYANLNEGQLPFAAVEKMLAAIKADKNMDATARNAMERTIRDMYLNTLDEFNSRQAGRMRKNRGGADEDMLRSFLVQGRADAAFISSLEYGEETNAAFYAMQQEANDTHTPGGGSEKASDAFNIFAKHYKAMLEYNPTPIQDAIVGGTSFWMLATNISYHLQNATQPLMVTLPMLEAEFAMGKAWPALMNGYKTMVGLVDKTGLVDLSRIGNKGLKAAMEMAQSMMLLDVGIEEDLGKFDRFTTGYKVVDGMTDVARKAMHYGRMAARRVEMYNRVSAGAAAYELAAAKWGHEKGMEYMLKSLRQTQGDYSRLATPLLLKSLPKPMVQFKKYQIMMATLYLKAIHDAVAGEDQETKDLARRQLAFLVGHAAIAAGATGLPVATVAAAVLAAGGGDDPKDLEREIRKLAGDKTLGTLLSRGLPAALGWDWSDKLGQDKIFSILPYTDVDLTKPKSVMEAAGAIAMGPAGGVAAKWADGAGLIGKGDVYKGVEKILPSGLGQAMKGYRFANEGLTLRNGDVVMQPEDVGNLRGLMAAIGVPSTELSHTQWATGLKIKDTQHFNEITTDLKHRFSAAAKDGDKAEQKEIEARWKEVQETRKEYGFPVQPLQDLYKAVRDQKKRERATTGGVAYTKTTRRAVEQLVGL